jgi:hypothetical protein
MALQAIPLAVAQNPDTSLVQHPVELYRNFTEHVFTRPGVTRVGGFNVASVPAALQVTVAAGGAMVDGPEATLQGSYFAWSQASETLSWPAAPGSTSRIDSLILRVADPQYGTIPGAAGASWDIVQGVVSGSPAARPDSYFQSGGGAYVPGGWLRVADVLISAGYTQFTAPDITWKAPYVANLGHTPVANYASLPVTAYEGERAYTLDNKFWYIYQGAAWHLWQPVRRNLAANMTSTVTALANVSGFSFPYLANTRYSIRGAVMMFTNSTAASAWKWTYSGTAAADTYWGLYGMKAIDTFNGRASAFTGTIAPPGANTDLAIYNLHGSFQSDTAGTLQLQFAQGLGPSGTITMEKGSHVEFMEQY